METVKTFVPPPGRLGKAPVEKDRAELEKLVHEMQQQPPPQGEGGLSLPSQMDELASWAAAGGAIRRSDVCADGDGGDEDGDGEGGASAPEEMAAAGNGTSSAEIPNGARSERILHARALSHCMPRDAGPPALPWLSVVMPEVLYSALAQVQSLSFRASGISGCC